MLETVKHFIQTLPDKDFEIFFNEYLMSVQDRGLDDEIEITLKNLHSDVLDIERLVQNEYGGLIDNK